MNNPSRYFNSSPEVIRHLTRRDIFKLTDPDL